MSESLRRATAKNLLVAAQDGSLRDFWGRDTVLRGINVGGAAKRAPFLPFPLPAEPERISEVAVDFLRPLVSWGLDTIRLPFFWEALEPSSGTFSRIYLRRLSALLDAAQTHNLKVILDFHQDLFSSAFGGSGFPRWAIAPNDVGLPGAACAAWYLGYLQDDRVRRSFDRLWTNADGLQDAFRRAWTEVCLHVGHHPAVVAVEVLNEPGWGSVRSLSAFKREVLRPFHETMVELLGGLVPGALIVVDPPGIDGIAGFLPAVGPRGGGNVAYGAHHYDPGLAAGVAWSGLGPRSTLASLAEFSRTEAIPIILSEFGVSAEAPGGSRWLTAVFAALDRHRMSGIVWEHSHAEQLWNGEDFSVVAEGGRERSVVDAIARPWLRALSGSMSHFEWDPDLRFGRATWRADGGLTELVFPPRSFQGGPEPLAIEGMGARAVSFEQHTGVLVVAAPRGTVVRVEFSGLGATQWP